MLRRVPDRPHSGVVLRDAVRSLTRRVRAKPDVKVEQVEKLFGGWDIIEQTAAQHAAEYGVTYDTSRTMFMRALARAIGAALRDAGSP